MLSLIHYQASTIYTYHKSSRAVIVHRSRVAKAIRNERRGASGRVFPRKISAKSFAASWGIHTYTEDLTRTDNFRIRRAHHILLSKYLDFRGQCIAIRLALVPLFESDPLFRPSRLWTRPRWARTRSSIIATWRRNGDRPAGPFRVAFRITCSIYFSLFLRLRIYSDEGKETARHRRGLFIDNRLNSLFFFVFVLYICISKPFSRRNTDPTKCPSRWLIDI